MSTKKTLVTKNKKGKEIIEEEDTNPKMKSSKSSARKPKSVPKKKETPTEPVEVTPLILASIEGKVDDVRQALKLNEEEQRGEGINWQDVKGRTALHYAVSKKQEACVEALLESPKCDVNIGDEKGVTPLMMAAALGLEHVVELLIQADNIDINKQSKQGNTALHYAARKNFEEICAMLLGSEDEDPSIRANKSIKNESGKTPLMLAAEVGALGVIKQLDPILEDLDQEDKKGMTALELAAKGNHQECMKYLQERESKMVELSDKTMALLGACARGDKNALSNMRKMCKDMDPKGIEKLMNWRDMQGNSLVHLCANFGEFKLLKLLIMRGANFLMENFHGSAPLHLAAQQDDNLRCVKVLVNSNGSVPISDLMDASGRTAVHIAARYGSNEILIYLMKKGADLTFDKLKRTPLHYAALFSKIDCTETLLEYANDDVLNATDTKLRSPLHLACTKGNISIARQLVRNGADVNLQDKRGRTPLHIAARRGDVSTVMLLLESEASIDIVDGTGKTALWLSCLSGNLETTRELLQHKASTWMIDHSLRTPLHAACALRKKTNNEQKDNETSKSKASNNSYSDSETSEDEGEDEPLTVSSTNWNVRPSLVAELLSHGASPESTDNQGRSPLFYCCSALLPLSNEKSTDEAATQKNMHELVTVIVEISEHLRAHKADLKHVDAMNNSLLHFLTLVDHKNFECIKKVIGWDEELLHTQNSQGWTPVHECASRGRTDILECLLENGQARLEIADIRGRTAYHLASYYQHVACLSLLIGAGSSVIIDSKDKEGKTPLHHASFTGSAACVRVLQRGGAKPNESDHLRRTALHMAAHKAFPEVVDILLQSGWNANAKDKRGRTPLLLACYSPQAEEANILQTVKTLANEGADCNIADNKGNTSLMFAAARGLTRVVEYLLQVMKANGNVRNNKNRSALLFAQLHKQTEVIPILESSTVENIIVDDDIPTTTPEQNTTASFNEKDTGPTPKQEEPSKSIEKVQYSNAPEAGENTNTTNASPQTDITNNVERKSSGEQTGKSSPAPHLDEKIVVVTRPDSPQPSRGILKTSSNFKPRDPLTRTPSWTNLKTDLVPEKYKDEDDESEVEEEDEEEVASESNAGSSTVNQLEQIAAVIAPKLSMQNRAADLSDVLQKMLNERTALNTSLDKDDPIHIQRESFGLLKQNVLSKYEKRMVDLRTSPRYMAKNIEYLDGSSRKVFEYTRDLSVSVRSIAERNRETLSRAREMTEQRLQKKQAEIKLKQQQHQLLLDFITTRTVNAKKEHQSNQLSLLFQLGLLLNTVVLFVIVLQLTQVY